jgi:AraC family transcriptional regulator
MDEGRFAELEPPRFERRKALLVGGLYERHSDETGTALLNQWQRLWSCFDNLWPEDGPSPIRSFYGLRSISDETGYFDYIAGARFQELSEVPDEFRTVLIPAQTYAVFDHRDHINTIGRTYNAIWKRWLPQAGLEMVGVHALERYGYPFRPKTGTGGTEILIAIKS